MLDGGFEPEPTEAECHGQSIVLPISLSGSVSISQSKGEQMRKLSNEEKLEEIYLVLSELRHLMHRENNTLDEYQRISRDYYKRIAIGAQFAAEMLPSDVVAKHDEA